MGKVYGRVAGRDRMDRQGSLMDFVGLALHQLQMRTAAEKTGKPWISSGEGGFEPPIPSRAYRFSRPVPISPKDQTHQEIRKSTSGEVPTVVPSLSEAASVPQFPPDLTRVIEAWDRLPKAIKTAILTLVKAGGGSHG
jgi:hypothetical protein